MTDTLPLFPLNSVLLPGGSLQLRVFEKRYRELVNDLCQHVVPDFMFGVLTIRQGWEVGEDNVDSMYDIGCTARLSKTTSLPADQFDVVATGQRRFRLLQIDHHAAPYLMARVQWLPDAEPDQGSPQRRTRLVEAARRAWRDYHASQPVRGEIADAAELDDDTSEHDQETDVATLAYAIADDCVLSLEDRQMLLSETDPLARLRMVHRLVRRETYLQYQLGAVPAAFAEFAQHPSSN